MNLQPITPGTCIVRNTASRKGRTLQVEPGRTASRQLYYGRIILAPGDPLARFGTRERETALICLNGTARIKAEGTVYSLGQYDALYTPRDATVEIAPGSAGCDIAEFSAPVAMRHPVQLVAFGEVQKDSSLRFSIGKAGCRREVNILIGKNVQAGRLMAGLTFGDPGNWTSWPPHEHAMRSEEAYLYIDMPSPAFGVQLVYTNSVEPELTTIVREGDVVLMPAGYHPNVAAPGVRMNYLWMMVANREGEDRVYGVTNVQPEFAGG